MFGFEPPKFRTLWDAHVTACPTAGHGAVGWWDGELRNGRISAGCSKGPGCSKTHPWPAPAVVPPSHPTRFLSTEQSYVEPFAVYQVRSYWCIAAVYALIFTLGYWELALQQNRNTKWPDSDVHMDMICFCEFILLFRERYCYPPLRADTVAKITLLLTGSFKSQPAADFETEGQETEQQTSIQSFNGSHWPQQKALTGASRVCFAQAKKSLSHSLNPLYKPIYFSLCGFQDECAAVC